MQYITIEDGSDFREISKVMTEHGYTMNHATARNVLLGALKKIATNILGVYNISVTEENISGLLKSQQFQDSIVDLLYLANLETVREN